MLGDALPEEDQFERELELERQREIYLRAVAIVRADVHSETWQAFEFSVIDGMSIEEAAKRTGKSIGAAYAARGRVMKRLQNVARKMLEGNKS